MHRTQSESDVTAVVLTTGEATTPAAIECVRRQDFGVRDIVEVHDVHPFHRALNQGASLVRTPFFVQVDADMLLDPDCVGSLRKAMRSDVGIVVGELRDALVGSVVGVKLFRRACFDIAGFPDSISPDTDFVDAIGRAGWRTVYVGRQPERPRTFGEHVPDYQPRYVFRKFLMEGQRYFHRSAPGGLRWHYGRLQRSDHSLALLARAALAAGFLEPATGDALGRPTVAGDEGTIAALAALVGGTDADVPAFPGTTRRDRFLAAWRHGRDCAERADVRAFRGALEALERLGDDGSSLALRLGLCRGFLAGGDAGRDFDRLEGFLGSRGPLPGGADAGPPPISQDEVFEFARQAGLKRFAVGPPIAAEFVLSSGSLLRTAAVGSRTDGAGRPRIDVPFRPFGTLVSTDSERIDGFFWCLDLLRRGYRQVIVPGPFGAYRVSLPAAVLGRLIGRFRGAATPEQSRLSVPFVRRMLAPPAMPYQSTPGRVLMISESLGRGGAERQLLAVAEGLLRRGFDVRVLSFSHSDPGARSYEDDLHRLGVEVVHGLENPAVPRERLLGILGSMRPEGAARLPAWMRQRMATVAQLVSTLRPEVIHAWGDGPGSSSLLAAGALGVGQIVVQQGSLAMVRRGHPGSALIRSVYAALLGRSGVTIVNNSLAGAIDNERWIGLPRGSIGVRYNGLLAGTVRSPAPAEVVQFKEALGWRADSLVVGTIARMVAVKDPDLWLSTAAIIAGMRPQVRFLFGGYGPLEEATRARASSLGLGDRIRFIGAVEDVGLVYAAMDVLLLTSSIEGVPNVMVEAQAAGRAVVAPDVGGASEALAEGVTGLIARPRDPQHLATAVLRLLDDEAWRERVRREGPRFVAERFDCETMVENTIRSYGVVRPRRD